MIIGRRPIDDEQKHTPLSRNDNDVWIYADNGYRFSSCTRSDNVSDLPLWIDFNYEMQIKELPSNSFNNIYFDWSVAKFIEDMETVLNHINRILKINGILVLPAGEQSGMRRACRAANASECQFEATVPEHGFPTQVIACACEGNVDDDIYILRRQVNYRVILQQLAYLGEIFGSNNVKLTHGFYPPAPNNKDGKNFYFIVTKQK